jgi:hypothetical protein
MGSQFRMRHAHGAPARRYAEFGCGAHQKLEGQAPRRNAGASASGKQTGHGMCHVIGLPSCLFPLVGLHAIDDVSNRGKGQARDTTNSERQSRRLVDEVI